MTLLVTGQLETNTNKIKPFDKYNSSHNSINLMVFSLNVNVFYSLG